MSSDVLVYSVPLKSVVTFINGDRSTNYPKADDYTSGGIPFISAADLCDGRIQHETVKRITAAAFERLRSGKIQVKDVLFCLRGSIGKLARVEADEVGAIASSLVILRANDAVDPDYLYYWLGSKDTQQVALSLNNGSAQPNLSVGQLQAVQIPLPDIKDQRSIALVLKVMDDRINLLRETNVTLEAIAQALFKSWFVDFDPVRAKAEGRVRQDGERSGQPRMPQASDLPRPGAEAGAEAQGQPEGMDTTTADLFPNSFEESELGLVPKGWKVGKVEDVMDLPYGKALKATDRIDGVVPVYGSGGITGYHNESLVDGPSIIVGRKGTVGSLYWEDRPFFPIDTVFYVKAKQPLTYCYYLLQTLGLEGMNTDGAVPGLNRNNAYRLQVVMPSAPALQAFDEIVGVIRGKIFSNSQQAQTLTQLRDTLLPRLISGQLRLPETEVLVTESME